MLRISNANLFRRHDRALDRMIAAVMPKAARVIERPRVERRPAVLVASIEAHVAVRTA